jgi:hypothetical protein
MPDLIAAIALAALSASGPPQVFVDLPTSATMATPPSLVIPGFIAPSLIFIHVVIYYRPRRWLGARHTTPT